MTELSATIISVRDETPDVKTFRLRKTKGFSFIPGQYCTVAIPQKFDGDTHPFTFSSSPTEPYLELTVKRMGTFTTALHALHTGDTLMVDGPHGDVLNFDESVKDDVVFLAGGSGITPFMAGIRYAIRKRLPNRLLLLFSNRTLQDIIYRQELAGIREKNITVVNTLTNKTQASWTGERGYITKAMIAKYINEPRHWLWYLCGPPPMIDSMKNILHEIGVDDKRVRIEPWQIPGKSG